MKVIVNVPETVVADALRGMAAAHPELTVEHCRRPQQRACAPSVTSGGRGSSSAPAGFIHAPLSPEEGCLRGRAHGRNNSLPPVIQPIVRGSVVEHYDSPAIASTLQKDCPGLPRKHWWIAEQVAEVSVHADRVFAPVRLHNSSPHGPQRAEKFISIANVGRTWSGPDEIPPGKARPHMFRRTMATRRTAGSNCRMTRPSACANAWRSTHPSR